MAYGEWILKASVILNWEAFEVSWNTAAMAARQVSIIRREEGNCYNFDP